MADREVLHYTKIRQSNGDIALSGDPKGAVPSLRMKRVDRKRTEETEL
ncbi:hypothetical protein FP2506_02110 [Fulvimarina pelagi HTCC2506]|uniref:Uncharacterized protein n=1 Tax=Fulvimarina pelagi HTCC2506 TaxID=314231 RepID=Q0FYJ8_9HYPH|nr:hypothetical protein FP2506_02110 [Fulvimarina pelagi HTCC2506]